MHHIDALNESPVRPPRPPLPLPLPGGAEARAPDAGIGPRAAVAPELPRYFPALDGLRFVCCTAVIIAHCLLSPDIFADTGHPLRAFAENLGKTGVEIFFSLSGFLITKLLLDEVRAAGRIDLRAFYMRRILRIWPAYYTAVALGFGIALLAPAPLIRFFGYELGPENPFFRVGLPLFALFLSNWTTMPVPSIIGKLWSVGVEEQFYVLFPISFAFARRRHPALRSVVIGLLVAWGTRCALAGLHVSDWVIYHNTFAHGDHLLFGALLAQALHAWPRAVQRAVRAGGAALEAGALLGCTLLTAMVFAARHPVWDYWWRYAITAVSTTMVVAVIGLGRGPVARLLSGRRVRALGQVTYGGYVFHMYAVVLAFAVCSRLRAHFGPWSLGLLRAVVAVPVAYAIAMLSKRLVEDPFLRLKRRFQPADGGQSTSLR